MRTSGAMICGGTLIAPDVVLTAAHCFADDLDHVVLGKYFRRNVQNESTEVLQIQSTHIHPYFSYDTKRFDQMLVTLSAPSSYPYLQNINTDGNVPSLTVNITVIGLGATGPNGTHPKVMQEGNLTVVPNIVCAGQGGNDDVGALIRDDHLCLQGPNNQGAQCYGDSGGPQLILGDTPEDDLLVGVVSWYVFPGLPKRGFLSSSRVLNKIYFQGCRVRYYWFSIYWISNECIRVYQGTNMRIIIGTSQVIVQYDGSARRGRRNSPDQFTHLLAASDLHWQCRCTKLHQ